MGHDPTKLKLGATKSSDRGVKHYESDPATTPAGFFVSLASTGLLSLLKSAGMRVGVSLGRSLSNTKWTAVCFEGLGVPVRLNPDRATGSVTISSYANLVSGTPDTITIGATVFTAQAGAATPGTGTFQAATSNNATAASLAAQINAHATAGAAVKAVAAAAVVTLYAKTGGAAGNTIAIVYTNNDGNVGATISGATLSGGSSTTAAYAVKGQKVYINDTTGVADFSTTDSTISDAMYASGVLTGYDEDNNTVLSAYVDMQGGL